MIKNRRPNEKNQNLCSNHLYLCLRCLRTFFNTFINFKYMIYNNLSVENGEGNVPFFAFVCLRSAGACLHLPSLAGGFTTITTSKTVFYPFMSKFK